MSLRETKKHLKEALGVEISRDRHIHHIDKNRENNDLFNLISVSLGEHCFIHDILKKEDFMRKALKINGKGLLSKCCLIRFLRLFRKDPELAVDIVHESYVEVGKPFLFRTLISWTDKDIKRRVEKYNIRQQGKEAIRVYDKGCEKALFNNKGGKQ